MAQIDDFNALDIRVGTIRDAQLNKEAKKPAYKLSVDFGDELGVKGSSAQICNSYTCEELIGRQIVAVVNFLPMKVAGFKFEVLILAAMGVNNETTLISPETVVEVGQKIA